MGSDRPVNDSSEDDSDWDHRATGLSNRTLGLILLGFIVLWFLIGVFWGYIVNQ